MAGCGSKVQSWYLEHLWLSSIDMDLRVSNEHHQVKTINGTGRATTLHMHVTTRILQYAATQLYSQSATIESHECYLPHLHHHHRQPPTSKLPVNLAHVPRYSRLSCHSQSSSPPTRKPFAQHQPSRKLPDLLLLRRTRLKLSDSVVQVNPRQTLVTGALLDMVIVAQSFAPNGPTAHPRLKPHGIAPDSSDGTLLNVE